MKIFLLSIVYVRNMASLLDDRRPKSAQQGLGGTRHLWVALAALAAIFLSHSIGAEPPKEVRRILILNEVGISYPGIVSINEAIEESLQGSKYRIEIYREYMETTLFSDEADQKRFRDFYIRKYQDRRPDLIITVGSSPLMLVAEEHRKHFTGIPVVFCDANGLEDDFKQEPGFTGVTMGIEARTTLKAALKLLPRTQRVFVVGGAGHYDRVQVQKVKEQLEDYRSRLDITYLTELATPELLKRLNSLPEGSIILFATLSRDSTGTHYTSRETGPLIPSAANAPVFSLFDVYFGYGQVGGNLTNIRAQGTLAGRAALEILDGVSPNDIPVAHAPNSFVFDWRALKRWGIRESDLPPGSRVVFREFSVWERTKRIWISGLLIILSLSALTVYLQFSRRQLKQARESQLQLSGLLINAQEMERRRLASELHDDFSQRLALLALGLENASEALPDSSEATKRQLQELFDSASELGADLHTVSHRLHPSALENLGLAPGVNALCKEFSSRQSIQVDFSSENIPRVVSPNVALCLFRIVQEGLQNLRKHSGASEARVSLRKNGDRLLLSVCDEGNGFDTKEMRNKVGLGIPSMGERVRLLGGQFEIQSEPGKGTRIEVSVPLPT
jgi:signal transduction histidine kinase